MQENKSKSIIIDNAFQFSGWSSLMKDYHGKDLDRL